MLLLVLGGGDAVHGQVALTEVTEVRFEGNEAFSDRVLASAIITRETECRSSVLHPLCWMGIEFTLEPYYFNAFEFPRDAARIKLFYYQRGYREAVVDTSVVRSEDGTARIAFHIEERQPVVVDSIEFFGVEEMDAEDLLKDLPLQTGGPLNGILLDAARDTLLLRLLDMGYAHAEVLRSYFIPRTSAYQARVTFDIYAGTLARFGPLAIRIQRQVEQAGGSAPEPELTEAVVRRMLTFREGDLFGQERQFAGQRNLYGLDIVRYASIEADLTHVPDSIVPVQIEVHEGDAHRVRAGAGLSTADCMNMETRWTSRNFFGGARRLQVRGRLSNLFAPAFQSSLCQDAGVDEYGVVNWLVSADFTQPWLFTPRFSLAASLYLEQQSVKDVFVRRAQGMNLALVRSLGPTTALTLSYRPQLSSLDAAEVFFCSSFLVCDADDIGLLQDANWISPIGANFSRNRVNDALNPTMGYSLFLDFEHAAEWTGSNFLYKRVIGETAWYRELPSGLVFAARVRGGWMKPGPFYGLESGAGDTEVVHPQTRLYAGGSNSVRGFAQNRLGPLVLTVDPQMLLGTEEAPGPCGVDGINTQTCNAGELEDNVFDPRPTGGTKLLEGSLELRFPVVGPTVEGAAFVDVGQVWPDAAKLSELEVSPGFGIRYFTPIGPVRVDLAYRFTGGQYLPVFTTELRDYDPTVHDAGALLIVPDGSGRQVVRGDRLVPLGPQVLWGESPSWSLRRFQLHLSIGQAF
jgi:outer membrane protein assembly factor BamA